MSFQSELQQKLAQKAAAIQRSEETSDEIVNVRDIPAGLLSQSKQPSFQKLDFKALQQQIHQKLTPEYEDAPKVYPDTANVTKKRSSPDTEIPDQKVDFKAIQEHMHRKLSSGCDGAQKPNFEAASIGNKRLSKDEPPTSQNAEFKMIQQQLHQKLSPQFRHSTPDTGSAKHSPTVQQSDDFKAKQNQLNKKLKPVSERSSIGNPETVVSSPSVSVTQMPGAPPPPPIPGASAQRAQPPSPLTIVNEQSGNPASDSVAATKHQRNGSTRYHNPGWKASRISTDSFPENVAQTSEDTKRMWNTPSEDRVPPSPGGVSEGSVVDPSYRYAKIHWSVHGVSPGETLGLSETERCIAVQEKFEFIKSLFVSCGVEVAW